jgi:FKBP-type peptidyl-prolyl cis-trans isomerase
VAKDADIYDESRDYEPFNFEIGGNVIVGWNVGFKLLKKGSKATFIFPSYLAYGFRGRRPTIPANEVLIFEVELIDFQ